MGNKKKKKERKFDTNERDFKNQTPEPLENNTNLPDEELNKDCKSQDSLKRQYNENEESDNEASPKKVKKRKKQQVPTETSGKKSKSLRQIKREKYAKRQAEAESVAKDQLKSECLSYLSQWKHNKQNWKFMKNKQLWLFKNKFSIQRIPEESWPILLEYFESAKGNIRSMLLDDAHKIIKQMDEWTEEQEKEEENTEEDQKELQKPDDAVYTRARSIIQCLEE